MAEKIISHRHNFSTPPSHTGTLPFNTRITQGHGFERELSEYLRQFGITAVPFGQEFLSPELKAEMRHLTDATSLFVRFLPDLCAILPNGCGTFLIECKSVLTSTDNYSINTSAYELQKDLAFAWYPPSAIRILYTFPPSSPGEDYRAEWIQFLPRTFAGEVRELRQLWKVNGSGLPFILIAKNKLRSLETILSALIESNTVHDAVNKPFRKDEYKSKLFDIPF